MNLIKITPLLKRRTKDMIADMMPEYKYSRITNSGIVKLKKNWWSFKTTTVNITDLYFDVFLKRLADNCKRKGYGDTYERIFSNDIYVILQLKSYKNTISIDDYVWQKYNALFREVPIIKIDSSVALSTDLYLPILSPVSSKYIPGVEKLLRNMKKIDPVESLIEKISKIRKKQLKALHEASRFVIHSGGLTSYRIVA